MKTAARAPARRATFPSVHPLRGPELRIQRRLQQDYPHPAYVFFSEREAPLTADAVRKIVGRARREAGIEFQVHPHMLRHATGYKLANDGQRYPGDPALAGTPQHPAHHPLYRTGSRSIQKLLA